LGLGKFPVDHTLKTTPGPPTVQAVAADADDIVHALLLIVVPDEARTALLGALILARLTKLGLAARTGNSVVYLGNNGQCSTEKDGLPAQQEEAEPRHPPQ
jgi:hypothetical protein